jgi:hypothetical protein
VHGQDVSERVVAGAGVVDVAGVGVRDAVVRSLLEYPGDDGRVHRVLASAWLAAVLPSHAGDEVLPHVHARDGVLLDAVATAEQGVPVL